MLRSQVMVDTQREGLVTEEPFLATKITTRLAVTIYIFDGEWRAEG